MYFPKMISICKTKEYKNSFKKQLKTIQKELDNLVYWETQFNLECDINENSKYLSLLEMINDILGEPMPNLYLTSKNMSTSQNNQFLIKKPSLKEIFKMQDLKIYQIEEFQLKNEKIQILKKQTCNNIDKFYLKNISLSNQSISEIEIDANEFLQNTLNVDVNLPRRKKIRYEFIYENQNYVIDFYDEIPYGILKTNDEKEIPSFLSVINDF